MSLLDQVQAGFVPNELKEAYELRLMGVTVTFTELLEMPALLADDLLLVALGEAALAKR